MKSHLLRNLYGRACFLLTVDWRDCLARAIEFRLVIEPATLHLGVLGLSELRYSRRSYRLGSYDQENRFISGFCECDVTLLYDQNSIFTFHSTIDQQLSAQFRAYQYWRSDQPYRLVFYADLSPALFSSSLPRTDPWLAWSSIQKLRLKPVSLSAKI
jgi:hypothetical protein